MRAVIRTIAVIAVAGAPMLRAHAVCLDEHGISGYHVPLDKEFREAYVVAIGTVVAEKHVSERPPFWLAGTSYRFRVDETLRGHRYKTLNLFSENTTGRFPMDIGEKYLVFVTKDRDVFGVSNCGNSTVVSGQSHVVQQVKEMARLEGKR